MKIILTQDVKNIGKEGDLVEVADGYARNFLLPRKFALPATDGNVKRFDEARRSRQRHRQEFLQESKALAAQMEQTRITLPAKTGEEGKLFGSITAADIAEALKAKFGQEMDKRKIELTEPIRRTGVYDVPVKLDSEVAATVTVEIVAA